MSVIYFEMYQNQLDGLMMDRDGWMCDKASRVKCCQNVDGGYLGVHCKIQLFCMFEIVHN